MLSQTFLLEKDMHKFQPNCCCNF